MSTAKSQSKISKRIYARRAVLSGILISASFMAAIIQAEIHKFSAVPFVIFAAVFAYLFSGQIQRSIGKDAEKAKKKKAQRAAFFIGVMAISPVLAPVILAQSVAGFFRAEV